jgi:hypothetical protein
MKVNERTRFPYPVLSPWSNDYDEGQFSVTLGVAESPNLAMVALQPTIRLDQPQLLELVRSGRAAAGAYVACLDTFFSRLIRFSLDGGSITFEPGALTGRVSVKPVVWAQRPIKGFPLSSCHDEFGGGTTDFPQGSILALAGESIINIGLDKLAQIETIFTIARSDALDAGTFAIELESNRIRILVAEDIHNTVNEMRGLKYGRPVVLNAVYLPAIMQVLDTLRENPEAYEGQRWHRIFTAKCDHLGINLEKSDLWRDAQMLLQRPFHSVERMHRERK